MSPAVEKEPTRYFNVELKDKSSVRVRADKICEPQRTNLFYTLKLQGEEVGRFAKSAVVGWWIEDSDASEAG